MLPSSSFVDGQFLSACYLLGYTSVPSSTGHSTLASSYAASAWPCSSSLTGLTTLPAILASPSSKETCSCWPVQHSTGSVRAHLPSDHVLTVVANATEEFFVRNAPLYQVVGQLGMWGMIINGIQASALEHTGWKQVNWDKHVIGFILVYTVSMFVLYSKSSFACFGLYSSTFSRCSNPLPPCVLYVLQPQYPF